MRPDARPLLITIALVVASACGGFDADELPTADPDGAVLGLPTPEAGSVGSATGTFVEPASTTTAVPRPPLGDVVVVGDSLSAGLAAPLRAALQRDDRMFDWLWWVGFTIPNPSMVWETVLAETRPDVVVAFFGAWESEVIREGGVIDWTNPDWPEVYRDFFIEPWVDLVRAGDTEIVWVGMPTVRDPFASAHYEELNAVWRSIAEREPAITWVDAASITAGPDGGFWEIDDTADPPVRMVALDGLHYCPPAAEMVADKILDVIAERRDVQIDENWRSSGWEFYPEAFGEGSCPPVTAS